MRERLVRAWRATQVELQGEYSDEQFRRFRRNHATASWRRVLLVCCLVPLPCIASTLLVGLLPLEPPENGPYKSPRVWLSQWISITQVTLCTLQQLRCHLPDFEIGRRDFFVMTILSTPSAVASCFALAIAIGIPLPFTLFVGTMPWFGVFLGIFVVRKYEHLRNRRGLPMTLARYLLFALAQINMVTLYPMYSAAYSQLSAFRQTAFVLVLPVLKAVFKLWISRTLPESNGGMPEAVIFNVEVFHSPFASLCMGNTVSPRTVAALMAIDALEAWMAFHDIHDVLR